MAIEFIVNPKSPDMGTEVWRALEASRYGDIVSIPDGAVVDFHNIAVPIPRGVMLRGAEAGTIHGASDCYKKTKEKVIAAGNKFESDVFNEKIRHEAELREIVEGRQKSAYTYTATIWIGRKAADKGKNDYFYSLSHIDDVCQRYCNEVGLCVTVTPTRFIYSFGREPGALVGLINYPRFPKSDNTIKHHALALGRKLMKACGQKRVSVVLPDKTIMLINPDIAQEDDEKQKSTWNWPYKAYDKSEE